MRTMFTSGFQSPAQSFWMGAQAPLPEGSYGVDYNRLRDNLNAAENQYGAVVTWLSKTINPRDALGSGADADIFQQWGTQIQNYTDEETRISQMLNSGIDVKISQDEYADLQGYMQLAQSMYAMVQKYGGFGGAATPAARLPGTLPLAPIVPAAQAKPGTPPAPGAKAPTAAIAPKTDSTPYYVAGGLAAGGIILALVLRK